MWLFDDLIKKSSAQAQADAAAQQASGQWSGQNDDASPIDEASRTPIVIQKTSEESILTEAPIAVRPNLPKDPSPVQTTAHDGEELIIVDGSAPAATTTESSSDPLGIMDTPQATLAENASPAQDVAPILGEDLMNATEKDSLHERQRNRMKEEDKIEITQEQEAILGNLLGETPAPTPVVAVVPEAPITPVKESAAQFETPMSFIEASLVKVAGLIDHIDTVRTAKLEEAANYKAEKERNAALEAQCYIDADKMMKEKAHADKMRKYLLSQQDVAHDTESEVSSVETTLATLSVKKSVGDTTDKKNAKKQKAEDDEVLTINT